VELEAGPPRRSLRILVAAAIATFAVIELYNTYKRPGHFTDFSIAWLGAKALLAGHDPYVVVGQGRLYDFRWPATYPMPAYIVAMPFTLLSERVASYVFVWLSTFALAFGVTRVGWYLLPIFATRAFFDSVHFAQWSIVFTAGLFIPWLQALAVIKPHTGLSIFAGAPSRKALIAATTAGVVLLAAGFIILPTWPAGWLKAIEEGTRMKPPLLWLGGPVILVVLLRWWRKEAWLILSMALLPQNVGVYATLPLLTVAKSFKESATLAMVATLGLYALGSFERSQRNVAAALLVTIYLPAVLVVLRRPERKAAVGEKTAPGLLQNESPTVT
jgi:hypothetical protein